MGRVVDAQGGSTRLAQARQDRPTKWELDLTNIYFVSYGMGSCPSLLSTIPQEGRNVEVIFIGRR